MVSYLICSDSEDSDDKCICEMCEEKSYDATRCFCCGHRVCDNCYELCDDCELNICKDCQNPCQNCESIN